MDKQLEQWALEHDADARRKSDGCTSVDALVRMLMPWIRPCCVTHDWVLVLEKLPRADADSLLRECIESKSNGWWSAWWFWIVALVFYGFTRLRSRLGSVSATYGFIWGVFAVALILYKLNTGK